MRELVQYVCWFFWLPAPKLKPAPKTFWDEASTIPPGQVSILTDKITGNQYALMHLDDFDHIIGVGKKFERGSAETVDAK